MALEQSDEDISTRTLPQLESDSSDDDYNEEGEKTEKTGDLVYDFSELNDGEFVIVKFEMTMNTKTEKNKIDKPKNDRAKSKIVHYIGKIKEREGELMIVYLKREKVNIISVYNLERGSI